MDVIDDLADFERHDCNGTDGYILRGGAMTQGLVQGVESNVLVGTNKNCAKKVSDFDKKDKKGAAVIRTAYTKTPTKEE